MLSITTETTPLTHDHRFERPIAASAVGVTKIYGGGELAVTALDTVDIDLAAGQLTAVMGPSGSGKSTLLQTLAGLDPVTAGSVMIGDTDITTLSERQLTRLRRDRVGFIFQAFNLIPMLTAEENIELPIRLAGRKADRDWIDEVIGVVGLTERRNHRPSELSGGQQQRVAVARSLASRPEIIFADEPTGNLDRNAAAEVLGMLRRVVREDGQTIVMVTHDPVAASYADRVVFLADGRIEYDQANPTVDSVLDTLRAMGG